MYAESHNLELRAAEQRRHLQGSVHDLKAAIQQKLDVRRNAREHLWAASGVAFLMALTAGYSLTDMIYRIRGRQPARDRWHAVEIER